MFDRLLKELVAIVVKLPLIAKSYAVFDEINIRVREE